MIFYLQTLQFILCAVAFYRSRQVHHGMYLPIRCHKESFHHPKTPTSTKALTTSIFTVSLVLPFADCHILAVIQYGGCQDWLLSLGNMHLGFLHVFSWLGSPVLFIVE